MSDERIPDLPGQVEIDQLIDLGSRGLWPELESRCGVLSQRFPDSGFIWKAWGLALWNQRKDGLTALRRAAQLAPEDAEVHSNLGNALTEVGRFEEAAASCRRALSLQPTFAVAHANLGNAWRALGRLAEAEASYRQALTFNPNFAETHSNLGNLLRDQGRLEDAVASYQRAVALRPTLVAAQRGLGDALFDLGKPAGAVACYKLALEFNPGNAGLHARLSHALLQVWDAEAAVDAGRQATVLDPECPQGHVALGNALVDRLDLEAAEASYRSAIALDPNLAAAHHGLACLFRVSARPREAEVSCREALRCDPGWAVGHALLAELKADRGQFREAEILLRKAASMDPSQPWPWAAIPQLRRMTSEDAEWLNIAHEWLAKPLPPRQQRSLRFALGKYHDDTGDYALAFANYQQANEIAKRHRPAYDRDAFDREIEALMDLQGEQWLHEFRPGADSSERPIIIVGMPRSGTTLIEQTLAAHPAVYGAGELMFWPRAAVTHAQGAPGGIQEPGVLGGLARDYLKLLCRASAEALRVIDKMPGNYFHLGMIHAALPNARIIHARRNAMDTCLSIYFHDFTAAHEYAIDLGDLAHQYAGYLRIMAHWRAHLPPGAMLEVPYEALVEDHEAWSRRMLAFVGLTWEDRCLHFQANDNSVRTFSRWQVRQKIVKTSVDRWRRYEKFVGPLRHIQAQSREG